LVSRRCFHRSTALWGLRWAAERELQNLGRIMAMANRDGDLYAACVSSTTRRCRPASSAAYTPDPCWEQIHRWKEYDPTVCDDGRRMIHGLTTVPDPNGTGRRVLIGFLFPRKGIIERIDSQRSHRAAAELDLKDLFGQAIHGDGR